MKSEVLMPTIDSSTEIAEPYTAEADYGSITELNTPTQTCQGELGYTALCATCPLIRMFGDCPKTIREQAAEELKSTEKIIDNVAEALLEELSDPYRVNGFMDSTDIISRTDTEVEKVVEMKTETETRTETEIIKNKPIEPVKFLNIDFKEFIKNKPSEVEKITKPEQPKKRSIRDLLLDDSVPIVTYMDAPVMKLQTTTSKDAKTETETEPSPGTVIDMKPETKHKPETVDAIIEQPIAIQSPEEKPTKLEKTSLINKEQHVKPKETVKPLTDELPLPSISTIESKLTEIQPLDTIQNVQEKETPHPTAETLIEKEALPELEEYNEEPIDKPDLEDYPRDLAPNYINDTAGLEYVAYQEQLINDVSPKAEEDIEIDYTPEIGLIFTNVKKRSLLLLLSLGSVALPGIVRI